MPFGFKCNKQLTNELKWKCSQISIMILGTLCSFETAAFFPKKNQKSEKLNFRYQSTYSTLF